MEGEAERVGRSEALPPDRQFGDMVPALDMPPPGHAGGTPGCRPEQVAGRVAPRAALLIATDDGRPVPPQALRGRADRPEKPVALEGCGRHEVHADPAFTGIMGEALARFREHLPAERRSDVLSLPRLRGMAMNSGLAARRSGGPGEG